MLRVLAAALALLASITAATPQTRPPAQKTGPITIYGPGSTGDVSAMTVVGPGATRQLLQALMDRPSVVLYGVDMTGVADSSNAFETALNSGKPITAPCGTIRTTRRLTVSVKPDFTGAGPCTLIKYDAAVGSPADLVINVLPSADGGRMDNFALTQQQSVKQFAPTTACAANIICGAAMLVQADNFMVTRGTFSDSYDNCLAFGRLDPSNQAAFVFGSPRGAGYDHIRTTGCGFGPRREAAGVNVATASATNGSDLVDVGSTAAWILDLGGGANGNFTKHTGINTPCAPADSVTGGRSNTFFVGSGDSVLSEFTSIGACDRAWSVDPVVNLVVNNYIVRASGKEALYIRARNSIFSNGIIDGPGYPGPAATAAGVFIDTRDGDITGLVFNGIGFHNANGVQASQGFFKTGAGGLEGAAIVTDTTGVASVSSVPTTFKIIQPRFYPN